MEINMKEFFKTKKQKAFLLLGLVLLLIMAGYFSYASFVVDFKGLNVNEISTCHMKLLFNDNNGMRLLSTVPMTAGEAASLTPYTFSIQLTETSCEKVNYNISMNSICDNCEKTDGICTLENNTTINCNDGYKIDPSLIAYSIKNTTTSEEITGVGVNNITETFEILSGETDIYEMRVWIDASATNEDLYVYDESGNILENTDGTYVTKSFAGKLNVSAYLYENSNQSDIPVTPVSGNLLSEVILARGVVTTGDGIYSTTVTTNGNPTYYYHGAIENNYVSFANLLWRVVRINEDGTIRMILEGGISNNTGNIYNTGYSSYSDMYHTVSVAKTTLESWYTNFLLANDSKIATSTFCEAAKVQDQQDTYDNTCGDAEMIKYNNYTPDFTCETDGNGYGLITNQKIGLITYEEMILAGGIVGTANQNYYLYNGEDTWSMSPSGHVTSSLAHDGARIWMMLDTGSVTGSYISGTSSGRKKSTIRPVISLNSNTIVSGSGTRSNPWIVL